MPVPIATVGGTDTPELALVAGALGGWGTADAIGVHARFGNLGQLAIADGRLYAPSHDVVRTIDLATAGVTTLPAPGAADLFGIARDGSGVLYAADDEVHAIFRFDPQAATWTPYAGRPGEPGYADGPIGSARFDGPVSLASDGGHLLYVGELDNHAIRTIDVETGTVSTLVDAGTIGAPMGLAFDGAATLYVADRSDSTIRAVDLSTGAVTLVAGQPGSVGGADGDASTATFDYPNALALDGHGGLWVSDGLAQTVRRIDLGTHEVTTPLGTYREGGAGDAVGSAASFNLVTGLAFDGDHLYLADSGNGEVRRADVATLAVTTWAGSIAHPGTADGMGADARFNAPRGLALAGDGMLYVADSQNDVIRQIDPASTVVSTVQLTAAGLPRGLAYPVGLVAYGEHSLIAAELDASDLVTIDLETSTLAPLAGTPFEPGYRDGATDQALVNRPRWVASDGESRVVFSDTDPQTGGPVLRLLDLDSHVVSTLSLDVTLWNVGGVALAGTTLFVSDPTQDAVWRADLGTGHAALLATVPGAGALHYDGDTTLYAAGGDGTVRAIDLTTAAVTTVAGQAGQYGCEPGALPGGLNGPAGLAGGAGPLYISDAAENSILVAR